MRAVGYFRETRTQTLAEQSESFLHFCSGNGFEAAATFLDAASQSESQGFRQMLEFVRTQSSHGFLLVAVSDLMNLGGAPTEAVRRYFQMVSLGVPIVSLNDGADLAVDLLQIRAVYGAW